MTILKANEVKREATDFVVHSADFFSLNREKVALTTGSISLVFAILIYVIFRSENLAIFSWVDGTMVGQWIEIGRLKFGFNATHLPNWSLYSLPDGLWLYSYLMFIFWVWEFRLNVIGWLWFFVLPSLAICSEIAQLLEYYPGTYDPVDLFFYILAIGASMVQYCFPPHK